MPSSCSPCLRCRRCPSSSASRAPSGFWRPLSFYQFRRKTSPSRLSAFPLSPRGTSRSTCCRRRCCHGFRIPTILLCRNRILQHRRCRHKSAAGVTPHSHTVQIHVAASGAHPLCRRLLVRQSIVPQISISITVVPLVPLRASATVAHFHHDKSQLCQRDVRAL